MLSLRGVSTTKSSLIMNYSSRKPLKSLNKGLSITKSSQIIRKNCRLQIIQKSLFRNIINRSSKCRPQIVVEPSPGRCKIICIYIVFLRASWTPGFFGHLSGHGFSLETSIPRRTKPTGQGRLRRGSGLEDEAFLSKGLGRQQERCTFSTHTLENLNLKQTPSVYTCEKKHPKHTLCTTVLCVLTISVVVIHPTILTPVPLRVGWEL